jgi:hypothetical protein
MSRFSRLSIVHLAILSLVIAFGTSSSIVRAEASSQTRTQELDQLQEAYNLLKIADKDYHGHRAKAMRAIETAAKDINGAAEGKRRGHEAQSTSDEQMRQAKSLLESVQTTASNTSQDRFSSHISKALKEIDTALSIK